MGQKKQSRCTRCGGLMIQQAFFDRIIYFYGYKCCNCGEVVDDKIVQNRAIQALTFEYEIQPAVS